MYNFLLLILLLLTSFCKNKAVSVADLYSADKKASTTKVTEPDRLETNPLELINFAQTLVGVPYKYGSSDPNRGFDCSGFITYVFNHFKINVPRSSIDFGDAYKPVTLRNSKPGDLILFTGTDSTKRAIGHMGIIVSSPKDGIRFIHSTSGKAYGVTETPLNAYYQGRFVKVVRIFKQND